LVFAGEQRVHMPTPDVISIVQDPVLLSSAGDLVTAVVSSACGVLRESGCEVERQMLIDRSMGDHGLEGTSDECRTCDEL
jgi:hypothetical protein